MHDLDAELDVMTISELSEAVPIHRRQDELGRPDRRAGQSASVQAQLADAITDHLAD